MSHEVEHDAGGRWYPSTVSTTLWGVGKMNPIKTKMPTRTQEVWLSTLGFIHACGLSHWIPGDLQAHRISSRDSGECESCARKRRKIAQGEK